MRRMQFRVCWTKNGAGEIDPIPDDVMIRFGLSADAWATSGGKFAQYCKGEIVAVARQMYEAHTEDPGLKLLRSEPLVWMNYTPDHDSGGGSGELRFLFKQENNGNSYRMQVALSDLALYDITSLDDYDLSEYAVNVIGEFRGPNGGSISPPVRPITASRAENFVMPFGKHKGKKLSEIPDDYLDWFYENGGENNAKISEMCRFVYELKKSAQVPMR